MTVDNLESLVLVELMKIEMNDNPNPEHIELANDAKIELEAIKLWLPGEVPNDFIEI